MVNASTRSLFLLAVLYPVLAFFYNPLHDPDIWWHLKTGEFIWQNRQFPVGDPFSFTAEQPWRIYAWIPEIFFYWCYRLGGKTLLHAFFLFFFIWFGWRFWNFLFRLQARPTLCFVFTLVSSFLVISVSGPRPQLFSYLFMFEVTAAILHAEREQNFRRLLILPPIFLLWANCHILFPLGLLFFAIYVVGKTWPFFLDAPVAYLSPNRALIAPQPNLNPPQKNLRLFWIGLACLLACFANPYGWNIFRELFPQFQNWLWANISELSPPGSQYFFCNIFYLFLPLCAIWLTRWGKELSRWEWIVVLISLLIPFKAIKFLPLPFIVALPILFSHGRFENFTSADRLKFSPVFVAALLFLSATGIYFNMQRQRLIENPFPEAAAEFLLQNPQEGRIANHYNDGGYLIFKLWPQKQVFVDGRAQIFSERFLTEDYGKLMLKGNWEKWGEVLDRHEIKLVLWPRDHALVFFLEKSGWKKIYGDDRFAIFRRN